MHCARLLTKVHEDGMQNQSNLHEARLNGFSKFWKAELLLVQNK